MRRAVTCAVAGAAIVVVIGAGLWIFDRFILRPMQTPYCDRHVRSDLCTCCILDESDGRILVQHSDLDINMYYLEIIEGEMRLEFALPPYIHRLSPQGYVARLIPGEEDLIEIVLGNDDEGIDRSRVNWDSAIRERLAPRKEDG